MNNTTLSTQQLVSGYDPKQALHAPLDLTLKQASITAILGANGQGKTTLLRTLLGQQPALSGTITRHGQCNFVPQRFNGTLAYSVEDMVLMGRASKVGLFSRPSQVDTHAVQQALSELKIEHLTGQLFNRLSGGQQQLVLIARALVTHCQTLILDEPTAALDVSFQTSVLSLLQQLAQERRISVIFSCHNPAHAEYIADQVLLLTRDKHNIVGPCADTLTPENLQSLYGVPIHRYETHYEGHQHSTLAPLFVKRLHETKINKQGNDS